MVIQAKLADSVRLECYATGDQPLSIDWFREGNNSSIEKHGNDLYDIHDSATDLGLSSFMQLRSVKMEDGLLYKCLARNEFGSSERLIKLIVLGVPERPVQLRVRDFWSRSALVSWQSMFPGNSRISNYTVQYWRKSGSLANANTPREQQQNHRREELLVDGLHSSALLLNLLPAVSYEVSVIAHNQVGRSEPSEPINVTTSEEEPSAPPTDVQVEARGSTSLLVAWKVPPMESWNGRLLGFYIGYRPRLASHHLQMGSAASLQSQLSALPQMAPLQSQQPQPPPTQQQQQQQLQQSAVFSFKTADAIEGQIHYDTFLTSLKHNQDYEITVRAFNKAGSGPECHVILARTSSARLPQAPQLQVQRVTSNSVTLRWTSTVVLLGARVSPSNLAPESLQQSTLLGHLDVLRYVLYYQPHGERDWFELTVSRAHNAELAEPSPDGLTPMAPKSFNELAAGSPTSGEVISSKTSLHTLSNLKPGSGYRIYVAAANDFGIGDPSNVVSLRTEALNSSGSHSAYLGSAHLLDQALFVASSSSIGGASSLFPDSWNQAHNLYTVLTSGSLLLILVLLAGYLLWQRRIRGRYKSSSASSYPSSWAPATSDTIQSEYSIKRFPGSFGAAPSSSGCQAGANNAASMEVYDEVACGGGVLAPSFRSHQPFGSGGNGATGGRVGQMHQMSRNMAATSARPVLSSHYHQPADLISNSSTLQLHTALGAGQSMRHTGSHQKSSATLNRNQNRQLPPIPYSTLSVKEMGDSGNKQWRNQHGLQSGKSSSEHRSMCNQQQALNLAGGALYPANNHGKHKQQQQQSTGGSQTPLIYGVIE